MAHLPFLGVRRATHHARIVDATMDLIAEKGLFAEVKDIAEHAGIGVGAIACKFFTKEE